MLFNDMGIIIRQSIKGTIVNYIGTAIGMITYFFIIPKYLTLEEMGLNRTFIDAGILFVSLAQIGTNSSILRFFPYFKDPQKRDNGFFFWTLLIPFIGFLIYFILFLIFKYLIASYFLEKSELLVNYLYFILPLGFFMLYQTVFETNSIVLQRIVLPAFVREVGVRLMLLISYILFAYDFLTLTGLIVSICCTYGIAAGINLGYLFHLGRISLKPNFKHITKPLCKDFLFYTFFLMGSALTTAFVPSIGMFIIGAQLGLAFAAIYGFARHIIALVEIPYRSLGAISNPHVSQTVKDNNFVETNRFIKKVSLHQFLISTAIFFLVWINIDLIFQIVPNGASLAPGKWVVFFLGMNAILLTSLSIGGTTLSFSKYYYYSLVLTLILSTTAVIMNVLCIPVWGINGAAIATLFASCLYYLLLLTLVFWKLKVIPLSWKHINVLTVILGLFLLNYLWIQYATPLIIRTPTLWVAFFEALLRTTLLGGIGFLCVYFGNISEEMNKLINKLRVKN
ncbi:MAG: oligosaccharide flippase family protein [Bacteroidales bacterium]|jgi:O-antigen/teichoic acid export membrane protein|nr:oligosaccharide flippase family protein [Bacteroidales bacterium]